MELIGKRFGISYKKHTKSNFGDFCIIEFLEKRFACVEHFNPFGDKKIWKIISSMGKQCEKDKISLNFQQLSTFGGKHKGDP